MRHRHGGADRVAAVKVRVRPKSSPHPPRTGLGYRPDALASGSLQRTHPHHLIEAAQRIISPAGRPCNRISVRVLEQIGRIRVGAFDRVPQGHATLFWPMKVSALLRLIESDGWQLTPTRGSHRQYKHPTRPGLVTVAGKPSDDLHPKTLGSILNRPGSGTTLAEPAKLRKEGLHEQLPDHHRR